MFGAAAAAGMFVSDPNVLIALRAVMGVGAAAIMPTTLSVITTSFPVEERPKAIGVWVGVAGGGAVLGLFGSGLLLEFFSWSSFFGLNVALAAVALVGTLAVVPTSVDPNAPRLDIVGAVLSLVAVVGHRVRDHRGTGPRLGRAAHRRGSGHRSPAPASPSCSGSCAPQSRCSTRGCSRCAASAPAR